MNPKKLLGAVIASIALSPVAAFADPGDELLQEWLASDKGSRTRAEVRADLARPPLIEGQRYPLDRVDGAERKRTRADVKAELAKHGPAVAGA